MSRTESRSVRLQGDDAETVENAIDAVDGDDDLPPVSRKGRPAEGELSRGEALAIIAEAFTGWSP